ncbi:MAG: SDR family NAD(P)-dependent oxidoreductase [Candidatus Aenigmarchaeota archaeon]|nr:SDR family NAD(P)-dependent oxidoreductase [Candidatus Aenigmarchaeota archaeon]
MILVTGAGGFIGQSVVERLLAKGYQLRLLARGRERSEEAFPKAEIAKGDVLNPESLEKAAMGVEKIIHLAGLTSYSDRDKERLYNINVKGTEALLKACKNAERIIFASSVAVYGETGKDEKADENYRQRPDSFYGATKQMAERLVLESGLDSVALRMAPVYGPGSRSWKKILRFMEMGFPIPKTGSFTHIVHVTDAAKAFEIALEKGKGVYNIADKKPIPFADLAAELARLLGKRPVLLPDNLMKILAYSAGMGTLFRIWTMNRHYDISKAGRELGYSPKAELQKEIRRVIRWYKSGMHRAEG